MNWKEQITQRGFADACLTLLPSFSAWRKTVDARSVKPHVREPEEPYTAALVLLYPYRLFAQAPGDTPVISAFYPASNLAYHGARELGRQMAEDGIRCRHASEIPYKPVAQRSGLSCYGKNCLQHAEQYGSLFALEVLCFYDPPESVSERLGMPLVRTEETEEDAAGIRETCTGCTACIRACPMAALSEDGIEVEHCLRFHMMKPVEEKTIRSRMGLRLLGCDSCNAACPENREREKVPYPEQLVQLFSFENLLDESRLRKLLPEMTEIIGSNYARAYPLLRQAALIAGNTGDRAWIPLLRKLEGHADAGVAMHAAWALGRLETRP
ncbi:MAG: hypothetical protein II781_02175 [Clostridia bacterium]|nr:hypothetical protein [Clostridia bacterium]